MNKQEIFNNLVVRIKETLEKPAGANEKLLNICQLLKENVAYYNWVGFYLTNPDKKDELILGPFVGKPTEHTTIPFGRGICGQAAQTKKTFIIQDVNKETNYLSCSPTVKSEIVIPLIKNDWVLGELDIDSETISPFTPEDRQFLEEICQYISKIL